MKKVPSGKSLFDGCVSHLSVCLSVCLQGRDESGHLAGGPPEEDHEQHTDYESSDAPPPWQGCPGVKEEGDRASEGQSVDPRTVPAAKPEGMNRKLKGGTFSVGLFRQNVREEKTIPVFLN